MAAALVGALALVPLTTATVAAADTDTYKELETFMGVFERVRAEYVDGIIDAVKWLGFTGSGLVFIAVVYLLPHGFAGTNWRALLTRRPQEEKA